MKSVIIVMSREPKKTRSPPLPATTTCRPMTKTPSWLTLPMLVRLLYLWLPATSRTTTAESSPAAPTTRTSNSTTLSSSLGTVQTSAPLVLSTTGWLGTAGENLGERTVTSGSLGKPPHSVAWTRKHLDTSARMGPAFLTPSTSVVCAACSSRHLSHLELISFNQRLSFWSCV